MNNTYIERLKVIQADKKTQAGLILAPTLVNMPAPIQRYDDPFLPFGKAIINATHDLVCAVLFDFSAYLALGAAGIVALERTIAYTRSKSDIMTVLHIPIASDAYREAVSPAALAVDAITVTDERYISTYADILHGGVYSLAECSNCGWYQLPQNILHMGSNRVQLFGDAIIGIDKGEGFAELVRDALIEAIRQ